MHGASEWSLEQHKGTLTLSEIPVVQLPCYTAHKSLESL